MEKTATQTLQLGQKSNIKFKQQLKICNSGNVIEEQYEQISHYKF